MLACSVPNRKNLSPAPPQTSTGCYASNLSDKVLYAGPYQTADEYHARRWQAVSAQTHTPTYVPTSNMAS